MRLKTTLSIILIVFASTAATFFSGLYFTNNSLEETMEQDLRFAIGVAGSLVGSQMTLMKTEAATLAERLAPARSPEELRKLMKAQFDEHPNISALSVFDRNGFIASYSVPPHEHAIAEHSRDIEMVYNGATIISSPFYCSTRGEFAINVYTPMPFGRILSASVPGRTFSDILAKHRLWKTGNIFMLNEAGRFIGAANEEIVVAMNDYITDSGDISERAGGEIGGLIQKILSSKSGVERYHFKGAEHLCAYNLLENSLMGWRVAVSVPLVESPQAEALRGQTYTAIFVLIIGAAAAFFLSKLALQPFKKIEAQNRDLEALNETIQAQASALLEEHGRIKLMLDATPLASRLWSRDVKLIECNEAAVKLFRLKDKREYIDRYFELSPPYQPDGQRTNDKIRMMVADALDKGSCTHDWMYCMLDGTPIPAEVTLVRLPYENDYVVAAYSRDLREQKEMISEIEQRDRLLRTTNQVASILLRAEPNEFEEALHTCMGMLAEEVNVDHIHVFENHADGEKLCCVRIETWSQGAEPRVPDNTPGKRIYYDEAFPGWLELLSHGACVNKTARDMSKAELKLIAPQGVLSMLVVPVFLHDTFWGFVSFDDCRATRLFTDNEISALRSASLQIFDALIRNGMLLDLRATAEQLEAALIEAKEASSAKSDFLANMSHEMRTPLNAIIGLSEITLDDGGLDEESRSNLEKIHNSGSTLLSIVNDILDISKIQAGKFVVLENQYDVPSLVNDAILQNVLRIGSKPIEFILNIGEDMPACLWGDELRIKQIINNLLSNAFKYTEEGTVELDLDHETDGEAVWMTIRVSDTGCGIQPEDFKRLFTDYTQFGSTSNQRAGGTGLGLAITKSLTEMMDGSIAVESGFGVGSVFTVRLRQRHAGDAVIGPAVAESLKRFQYSANKLNRNTQLKRIRLPDARVLVVDDNVTNLDVARGLLRPYGMKVDCATGGLEAVRAVREEKQIYDAVFMDHMMPGMDGIEATRIIREEIGTEYARTVPIIALTANAVAGSEEMFLRSGFQGFISKPIDLARLDEVVRHFLRDGGREAPSGEEPRTAAESGGGDDGSAGSELLASGPTPEGLDVRQGLERYGDDAAFTQILRSYAVNTKPLLESIGQPSQETLADYAITVHGLKSASRSVCAEPAGALAEALEHAAEAGDFDFVTENNPAFIKAARELVENIEAMLNRVAAAHPKPKKEKPDGGALQRLYAACDDYDFTAIDEIMEEIEAYEYTSDDGLALWLRENITQMNWSRVMERLAPPETIQP